MIAIIDYGMGNLRSVEKALIKLGQEPVITDDEKIIKSATHVILPGDGAVRDAIDCIKEKGLDKTIYDVIDSGKPFLGICLGMQMMFEKSYENGEFDVLGIYKGYVKRFDAIEGLKVPHMGWNRTICNNDKLFNGLNENPYFYYVHSYHAWETDYEQTIGITNYGYSIPVIMRKGNAYGTQFHPEKSGEDGMKLLKNFCEM